MNFRSSPALSAKFQISYNSSAGMDSKVKIWDAESGNEILDIPIGDYCVNTPQSFLFCQNNLQLAITSVNQFAVLDLRSGSGLKSLPITENLPTNPGILLQ